MPHISKFLDRQSITYEIFIVNQVDEYRFNRASLINVGFLEAISKRFDYIAMHDVDLLPLNHKLNYSYPSEGPFHVSRSGLHPTYSYEKFIGGILIVNKFDYIKTNGMSNRYWGWGKEDDDFYLRLLKANLKISRPDLTQIKTGKRFTFKDIHDPEKRPRDNKRFLKQKQESLRLERSGLNNVQYLIKERHHIVIESYPCLILDVQLFCDKLDTHWCTFDYQFND